MSATAFCVRVITALLQLLLERWDGDAVDHLRAERIGQEVARRASRQEPAAPQVEHLLASSWPTVAPCAHLTSSAKISSCGLVSTCALGTAAGCGSLRRIGQLRALAHDHLAVEYRVRGAVDDALVQLPAPAVRLRVVHHVCVSASWRSPISVSPSSVRCAPSPSGAHRGRSREIRAPSAIADRRVAARIARATPRSLRYEMPRPLRAGAGRARRARSGPSATSVTALVK